MSPIQATPTLLTSASVIYVCLLVGIIGLIVLGGIAAFGVFIYRGRLRRSFEDFDGLWFRLVERWLHEPGQPVIRPLIDAYTEQLQRRNEFWTSYGQIIVAVLIIVVLSILLLTRSISAEAGLPILSGISGFTIAKSVSSSRGNSPTDPERRG
jgi:hypothetical protein